MSGHPPPPTKASLHPLVPWAETRIITGSFKRRAYRVDMGNPKAFHTITLLQLPIFILRGVFPLKSTIILLLDLTIIQTASSISLVIAHLSRITVSTKVYHCWTRMPPSRSSFLQSPPTRQSWCPATNLFPWNRKEVWGG